MIKETRVADLSPDQNNPRKPDENRLALLAMSLQKLGFILPIHANKAGLILSGHQRHTVAQRLSYENLPAEFHDLNPRQQAGINILFNRTTNDFNAFDTGSKVKDKLSLTDVVEMADGFENWVDVNGEEWYAYDSESRSIKGLARGITGQYDKKASSMAKSLMRLDIKIPIVITDQGEVVNGAYRLFAAREEGFKKWPIIEIDRDYGVLAMNFLNYLSMDYDVDEGFADLLRYSAYRRPQNNRGKVPKAMRFWANGHQTRLDRESYSKDYWSTFREIHGNSLLDFGSGLCKARPFLEGKGFSVCDFEPYRIDPGSEEKRPSPLFSKTKAREFLAEIASGRPFDSIFLASVMNSIPFPQDRMAVLIIVHALSGFQTGVYGTCRDMSDFVYEYGGVRNANYFVFDSEPGVRLGDSLANPKLQKFHERGEFERLLHKLWVKTATYKGGNVFYWEAKAPKRVNQGMLEQALAIEFDLPYSDGTRMGLVQEATEAFRQRFANMGR